MFLAGATFVGHDWSTGSMSNQLLFESRRLLIWGAKALAVMSAALALGLVTLTAYWLGLFAVVQSRDIDLRDGALLDCLQHGWRGAGVAAAAALGGYALTNLFRSTVFALGVLFGVSVAGGLLLASIGPDDPGWLDPTINALAVISDGTTYYVDVPDSCFNGPNGFDETDAGVPAAAHAVPRAGPHLLRRSCSGRSRRLGGFVPPSRRALSPVGARCRAAYC